MVASLLGLFIIFLGGWLTWKKLSRRLFNMGNVIATSLYLLVGLYFSVKKYQIPAIAVIINLSICFLVISILLLVVSLSKGYKKSKTISLLYIILFVIIAGIFSNKKIPYFENTFYSISFTLLFAFSGLIIGFLSPLIACIFLANYIYSIFNHLPLNFHWLKLIELFDIESGLGNNFFAIIIFLASLFSTTFDTYDIFSSHHSI